MLCGFFFFKQKTAYEMRISDWSSDVCSSDRTVAKPSRASAAVVEHGMAPAVVVTIVAQRLRRRMNAGIDAGSGARGRRLVRLNVAAWLLALLALLGAPAAPDRGIAETYRLLVAGPTTRSEEHTSALQSLMRSSYAVFCLK